MLAEILLLGMHVQCILKGSENLENLDNSKNTKWLERESLRFWSLLVNALIV